MIKKTVLDLAVKRQVKKSLPRITAGPGLRDDLDYRFTDQLMSVCRAAEHLSISVCVWVCVCWF